MLIDEIDDVVSIEHDHRRLALATELLRRALMDAGDPLAEDDLWRSVVRHTTWFARPGDAAAAVRISAAAATGTQREHPDGLPSTDRIAWAANTIVHELIASVRPRLVLDAIDPAEGDDPDRDEGMPRPGLATPGREFEPPLDSAGDRAPPKPNETDATSPTDARESIAHDRPRFDDRTRSDGPPIPHKDRTMTNPTSRGDAPGRIEVEVPLARDVRISIRSQWLLPAAIVGWAVAILLALGLTVTIMSTPPSTTSALPGPIAKSLANLRASMARLSADYAMAAPPPDPAWTPDVLDSVMELSDSRREIARRLEELSRLELRIAAGAELPDAATGLLDAAADSNRSTELAAARQAIDERVLELRELRLGRSQVSATLTGLQEAAAGWLTRLNAAMATTLPDSDESRATRARLLAFATHYQRLESEFQSIASSLDTASTPEQLEAAQSRLATMTLPDGTIRSPEGIDADWQTFLTLRERQAATEARLVARRTALEDFLGPRIDRATVTMKAAQASVDPVEDTETANAKSDLDALVIRLGQQIALADGARTLADSATDSTSAFDLIAKWDDDAFEDVLERTTHSLQQFRQAYAAEITRLESAQRAEADRLAASLKTLAGRAASQLRKTSLKYRTDNHQVLIAAIAEVDAEREAIRTAMQGLDAAWKILHADSLARELDIEGVRQSVAAIGEQLNAIAANGRGASLAAAANQIGREEHKKFTDWQRGLDLARERTLWYIGPVEGGASGDGRWAPPNVIAQWDAVYEGGVPKPGVRMKRVTIPRGTRQADPIFFDAPEPLVKYHETRAVNQAKLFATFFNNNWPTTKGQAEEDFRKGMMKRIKDLERIPPELFVVELHRPNHPSEHNYEHGLDLIIRRIEVPVSELLEDDVASEASDFLNQIGRPAEESRP